MLMFAPTKVGLSPLACPFVVVFFFFWGPNADIDIDFGRPVSYGYLDGPVEIVCTAHLAAELRFPFFQHRGQSKLFLAFGPCPARRCDGTG